MYQQSTYSSITIIPSLSQASRKSLEQGLWAHLIALYPTSFKIRTLLSSTNGFVIQPINWLSLCTQQPLIIVLIPFKKNPFPSNLIWRIPNLISCESVSVSIWAVYKYGLSKSHNFELVTSNSNSPLPLFKSMLDSAFISDPSNIWTFAFSQPLVLISTLIFLDS